MLKAELIHLVEEVPGVEGVDALDIRDEQRNVGVEHLRLDDDELPFLVHVARRGEGPRRHPASHGHRSYSTAASVRVPDVVGHALDKAQILLEDAGLAQVVMLYRESYEDRDTVLDQRPARGQMVYEGSEVTIWVARRGYLEHLPAIYRRSDAIGRNLVRDVCFVFEHMFDSVDAQPDRRLAVLRSARRAARVLAVARGVDGVHASISTGPRRRSARSSSARSTSIASAAPSAGSRCSSSCSPATSPTSTRTPGRSRAFGVEAEGADERRAHRPRLGRVAAGRSRALLRRDDADPVRGRARPSS